MSGSTILETVTEVVKAYSLQYGGVTATDVFEETEGTATPASKAYAYTILYQLQSTGKVTKIGRGKYCWTEYLQGQTPMKEPDTEHSNLEVIENFINSANPEGVSVAEIELGVAKQLKTTQDPDKAIYATLYNLVKMEKIVRVSRGKYGPVSSKPEQPELKSVPVPEPEPKSIDLEPFKLHASDPQLDDETISRLATFVTELGLTQSTWEQAEVALRYFFAFKAHQVPVQESQHPVERRSVHHVGR